MKDLRRIVLCKVVYKIISKFVANWVNKVLDLIISDTQNAFIPVRLIIKNIMVKQHYGGVRGHELYEEEK